MATQAATDSQRALAAIAVGGYVAYEQVLRGDDIAVLALQNTGAPSADPTAEPATTAAASTEPGTAAGMFGEWQIASDSVAGYRVREQLANLLAESDAVGRTSDVTGSITVEGNGNGARLTAGATTGYAARDSRPTCSRPRPSWSPSRSTCPLPRSPVRPPTSPWSAT